MVRRKSHIQSEYISLSEARKARGAAKNSSSASRNRQHIDFSAVYAGAPDTTAHANEDSHGASMPALKGEANVEETFPLRFSMSNSKFWGDFRNACSASEAKWKKHRNLLIAHSFPQEVNGKDEVGETMLTLAAKHGRTHVIAILHGAKGDFSVVNSKGWAPLHVAVANNCVDVVKKIYSLGGSLDVLGYGVKCTPAHIAVQGNRINMLTLLHSLGANFSIPSNIGATLLHTAAEFDARECVSYLLKVAPGLTHKTDHMNETPAHKAARAGHSQVLKMLTVAGANLYSENVEEDSVKILSQAGGRFC